MRTEYRLTRTQWYWYLFASAFAIFVYFYGLDSLYIPKNGDEFPYAHITRLTADSGEWLPLQSELDHMRNTKPPLLFWQGIYTTDGGEKWTLWNLRYPSVIYTLLTALLVGLLAHKLSYRPELGFVAGLTFLAFFSTYRFGRPFLVNPGETFWLFLPFFTLLYWRDHSFASRVLPVLLGLEIGMGLLYKSFALLAPVGVALAWWYLHQRQYAVRDFLRHDAKRLGMIAVVSLFLFSFWFLLDPDPQSVWNEFVVGENAGKFEAHEGNYLAALLWGGSSFWTILLGYPLNAGLLFFPVLALMIHALRFRRRLSDGEKMLWFWCIVLALVFTLPSQRSARYLLDAMPALAVLCALSWHRISRYFFMFSLLLVWTLLVLLGSLALRLEADMPVFVSAYGGVFWGVLGVVALLAFAGIFVSRLTRALTSVVVLSGYLVFAMFLRPLDGPLGHYDAAAQAATQEADIWVPCNFRAGDEGYRFLLPEAEVHGYQEAPAMTAEFLSERYPMFVVHTPVHQAKLDCEHCQVIGQRLDVRSRHSEAELKAMLYGDVYENLFARELLVATTRLDATAEASRTEEGCR